MSFLFRRKSRGREDDPLKRGDDSISKQSTSRDSLKRRVDSMSDQSLAESTRNVIEDALKRKDDSISKQSASRPLAGKTGLSGLGPSVSSTISKDMTGGQGARNAALLGEFGKKNTKDMSSWSRVKEGSAGRPERIQPRRSTEPEEWKLLNNGRQPDSRSPPTPYSNPDSNPYDTGADPYPVDPYPKYGKGYNEGSNPTQRLPYGGTDPGPPYGGIDFGRLRGNPYSQLNAAWPRPPRKTREQVPAPLPRASNRKNEQKKTYDFEVRDAVPRPSMFNRDSELPRVASYSSKPI